MRKLGIYTQNVLILQLTQQMASWIHRSGEMKNLYTEMRVFLETRKHGNYTNAYLDFKGN